MSLIQKQKNILRKTYYNASNPASFGGVQRLAEKTNLNPEQVQEWLSQQWTYSLHKPVKKKFQRRKYVSRGLNQQWQADLVEMQQYSRENQGYRYILTVIDIFSRFAYALPLKNKTGMEVANVLDKLFENQSPKYLQTDQGLEFYNSHVTNILDKYNVELFSIYSDKKAAIVERFNRSLKEKMFRMFTFQGNYKWIDKLQDLVSAYNNSYHRTLKNIPAKVNKANETDVWLAQYSDLKLGKINDKFSIGDHVRITKLKSIFDKGYSQNWTDEEFIIQKINTKYNPITYTLSALDGEILKGSFYSQELQKVPNPSNLFRIEKVLRTRMNNGVKEALVKWMGFKEPSWTNYSNIKSIN